MYGFGENIVQKGERQREIKTPREIATAKERERELRKHQRGVYVVRSQNAGAFRIGAVYSCTRVCLLSN